MDREQRQRPRGLEVAEVDLDVDDLLCQGGGGSTRHVGQVHVHWPMDPLLETMQPGAHSLLAHFEDRRDLIHRLTAERQQDHLGARGEAPDGLATEPLELLLHAVRHRLHEELPGWRGVFLRWPAPADAVPNLLVVT